MLNKCSRTITSVGIVQDHGRFGRAGTLIPAFSAALESLLRQCSKRTVLPEVSQMLQQ